MKELQILGRYLQGEELYYNAINEIKSIINSNDPYERSRYTPIVRCLESCEFNNFFDFCSHLRQVLGYYNSPIYVSEEIYNKILPYKKRYGFIMTNNGSFEINIRNEMISDVSDLRSVYRFEKRKTTQASISNGAVYRYFQYQSFTSLQQKMMMYFVCNLKPNQTLLACLPTGGGKSFSWQFLAVSELYNGCIIVVVPTIALAINHERSARSLFEKISGFSKTVRAYSSDLGVDGKRVIFEELDDNKLSLLFVSPEALLAKEFKNNILQASEKGKVSALIVDEVHLVVSWGMKFRPEFQLLPSLRDEIQRRSPTGIKTILLSATITEYDKKTITRLFNKSQLIEFRADELRSEPEYYVHECLSSEEREEHLKSIVDQAPKPMIIYTVTPGIANRYYNILHDYGYNRIEVFTGNTTEKSRRQILNDWDNDNIDIIVATSAFGMGVDKPDIRTIVTTYIPESVSRYYQEVGRAGRDGFSALNFWLYCYDEDDKIIKKLTDTALLTGKRLSERWSALYKTSKRISANQIRISMDSAPEDMRGNLVGKQHANWNKDAVLLLYREGIIDIADLQYKGPLEYQMDVVLNNIPVLEDQTKLEEYISDFRDEERESIDGNKDSIYAMLKYHSEECFSTFFTKEFPYAGDTCSGCPYCRSGNGIPAYFSNTIEGTALEKTKNKNHTRYYDNLYLNRICQRGLSFITFNDVLPIDKFFQFTEFMVRSGIECLIAEKWNSDILKTLSDLDRANYLLLTYDEFYKIDVSWINGPIVLYMMEDDINNDEIYETGKNISEDMNPVVFVGNASIRINSEGKALKELTDYNVPLDTVIGGEFL